MATSGSYNFSVTRADIIEEAYEICGAFGIGNILSSDETSIANRKLNMMLKAWAAQGVHLWGIHQATLFLSKGTASYSLGPTGTHCATSYVKTTLSAAAASGATTLSLTSTTGLTAADNIGIVLDDGTIHWTTITTVATTLIATGLASAAASGNVVFAYTTKIQRPNRILIDTAYRRDIDDNDTPIELVARTKYLQNTNKVSKGKSHEAWYDPTLTNGTLYLYPTPDLVTDVLRFSFERPLQDFDAAGDEPDLPIEWAEPITHGLAARLSLGLNPQRYDKIKGVADEMLSIALGFDRENTSVFFQPDIR